MKGQAELVAISFIERIDLTYGEADQMEKAYRQYVSGRVFSTFGLKAAISRVFTERDDTTPSAHPCAVLSYDYWGRRFGGDPHVVGRRTFQAGSGIFQIIGVVDKPYRH